MSKVVVTGLGCITPIGHSVNEFADSLFSNSPSDGVSNISLFKSDRVSCDVAAEVKGYEQSQYFSNSELKLLDRFSQFALIASEEAIKQANISEFSSLGCRAGVIYGTGVGGQVTTEYSYQQLYLHGKERSHPFTVPKLIPSAAASQISMKYGITGPSFCTSSACSSSGHAIAMAVNMIRSGMLDIAVVGGAEACITEGNFLAWEGLRVLSRDKCRPFSANRTGLIIGEGAGSLVLESETHALGRGAKILASLSGIGMSSDAHNIVQPHKNGAVAAMKAAMDDANLSDYRTVDYINAHGSGTKQNDLTETMAIKETFGAHAKRLAVSSTKSQHGHLLGAGSAIEAIASVLAINHQLLPCTLNLEELDPECDLDYVSNEFRKAQVRHVLSNSFAFGGLNTSLIFSIY